MIKKLLLFLFVFAAFQLAINHHLLKIYDEGTVKIEDDFVPIDTDRPWMVFHVGPPKTGTTTIQKGLAENSPLLAGFDKVFYLGQSSSGPKKEPKTEHVPYVDHDTNKNVSIPIFSAKTLFWPNEEMATTLERYRQGKQNVVISSEHFTSKFPPKRKVGSFFDRIFNSVFLRQEGPTKRMIQEIPKPSKQQRRHKRKKEQDVDQSDQFGFNVKVVVNYRHYFQWLPSFYFQSELVNKRHEAQPLIQFIEESIQGLGAEYFFDGENSERKPWSQTIPLGLENVHGTLWSYMQWSSPASLRNRVEIFDLHQQQIVTNSSGIVEEEESKELFHNFVCQAVPAAPETCSQVREANVTLVERARTESGILSSLESGILSHTQIYQLKSAAIDRFPELEKFKKATKNLTTIYDVDPADSIFQYARYKNRLENYIRANFFDWVQERKSTDTDDGHRQLCLSDESTLALKTVSWNMLRHLEALVRIRDRDSSEGLYEIFEAPDIHRPKHPLLLSPRKYDHGVRLEQHRDDTARRQQDEEWWVPIKRKHDKLFDQNVKSGAYCELDLERLFADENFVKKVFYRSDQFRKRKNNYEYPF